MGDYSDFFATKLLKMRLYHMCKNMQINLSQSCLRYDFNMLKYRENYFCN